MSRHRTRKLEQVTQELEMSFEAKDDWGLLDLLGDFRLFKKGFGRRITNIISKEDGLSELKVKIFDYRYVISTGNSSRRFKQSVLFLQSKELGLPEFWLQPEHLLHKIGNLLGFEDINFEHYPQFSRQYRLTGKEEDLVRHAFKNEILRYFTLRKNWRLEGLGYYFILYQKDVLLHPEKVAYLYKEGIKIWGNLK
ncbi:MAG: hypothetical protein AAF849_22690 [Bacteroidota bacterium]